MSERSTALWNCRRKAQSAVQLEKGAHLDDIGKISDGEGIWFIHAGHERDTKLTLISKCTPLPENADRSSVRLFIEVLHKAVNKLVAAGLCRRSDPPEEFFAVDDNGKRVSETEIPFVNEHRAVWRPKRVHAEHICLDALGGTPFDRASKM